MKKHMLSYHVGHPNPQKFRSNYQLLNGEWAFVFDENDEGLDKNYQNSFPAEHLTIQVPYPYQAPASGINLPDKQCDVVWYEREFDVDDVNQNHVVTFNSVDYHSMVFVNGMLALEHIGGYDVFQLDVTPYVHKGKNKLTLRIVDEMDIDQIRGKQRWRQKSFTCFYTETSGIVRDVYIEHVSNQHVEDFLLRADYDSKSLTVQAKACQANGCTLKAVVSDLNDNFVGEGSVAVQNDKCEFVINFDDIVGWSHENPYLYNVKLVLQNDGKVVDEILSYCGFTTIATKDKHFYVNGKDTYLKFVLNQGYWQDTITTPSEKQIVDDVKFTLDCGFNGARMHEHTPSPLNFYYMDLYGLYAWHECPSAHGYSFKAQKQYYKQFPRIIKDHFSHPCIMAYVLFNESWGVTEIRESDEIREMTAKMYKLAKAQVGDRLVISNDGWEHTISDVLTFHNYAEKYQTLVDFFTPNLQAIYDGQNAECINNFKNFYAGEYRYGGQPVMFSEFAGIAFDSDTSSGWGYGDSVATAEDFLEKYKGQLQFILEREEIHGFCMTQLTDVYQEKNGLYTMARAPKVDIDAVKKLHDQFC